MIDIYLELRTGGEGGKVVMVVDGKDFMVLEGTAEAMRRTIEATAEDMKLPWYDLRQPRNERKL